MRTYYGLLFVLSACMLGNIFSSCTFNTDDGWIDLLDKDLTQWRIYQSYEDMPGNARIPQDENGETIPPIGYDKNEKNVFSIVEENGELLLKINGEIYGCIFTKESFRNYHLTLQYKFGTNKFPPRLDKAMDSGVLYHSQGEAGVDYWKTWMLAQEFQVMEAGTTEGVSGDYWPISRAQVEIRATRENEQSKYTYNPEADWIGFGTRRTAGSCAALGNFTNPPQEWTTLELICYEGKSLHIVNGTVVMALQNSSYWNGTESLPLVEGKIQLQCEAAELYYKNIRIKNIEEMPSKYVNLF